MVPPRRSRLIHKQQLAAECPNPNCEGHLTADTMLITDWPYIHADIDLKCSLCQKTVKYGIPLDNLAGSNLQIYHSKPGKALKRVSAVAVPECPFHHKPMVLTKIFGDKVYSNGDMRVQFKCGDCYCLEHITV